MNTTFAPLTHEEVHPGEEMHQLASRLFPICRSITGSGVRETLQIMSEVVPLTIFEVPTGTAVFDWTVPKEWNIRDAYIKNSQGERIVDFQAHNLHVLNYSIPVQGRFSLAELKPHLYSQPDMPDAIPYRTSYYQENWGFCLTHRQLLALEEDDYEVCIDAKLEPGSLTYAEYYLPGERSDEIVISAHTCHPSMANDNLSGLMVALFLARELTQLPQRKYSYRFVFAPTTIGTITWLAQNRDRLSEIKYALTASFLGDPAGFAYKKSKPGNSQLDLAAEWVLKHSGHPYRILDFSPYGDDGRQYNSPGINIPAGNLTRSQFGEFPEYHTSADDLELVQAQYLAESLTVYRNIFEVMEANEYYQNLSPYCEPQLGKRGLYQMIGGESDSHQLQMAMLWVLNYSDGQHSLLEIAQKADLSFAIIQKSAQMLLSASLIKEV